MPEKEHVIVAPADAKALVGSLKQHHQFFIKEKFFAFEELLGPWQKKWLQFFKGGSFAIFRLTLEKYHYNHLPVSGNVVDFYTIDGDYHSCNPAAVVAAVTPYSKNRRTVTIIDTDVPGGTQVGLVAMVEIVQAYSIYRYNDPQSVKSGMFVKRGQPKSLFRPGSSVDILFFEPERMVFDADLTANCRRIEIRSRFSIGFRQPLVETDVRVRSSIGKSAQAPGRPSHK